MRSMLTKLDPIWGYFCISNHNPILNSYGDTRHSSLTKKTSFVMQMRPVTTKRRTTLGKGTLCTYPPSTSRVPTVISPPPLSPLFHPPPLLLPPHRNKIKSFPVILSGQPPSSSAIDRRCSTIAPLLIIRLLLSATVVLVVLLLLLSVPLSLPCHRL